eukprot:8742517-Pyramimonas_sp.AAC.1
MSYVWVRMEDLHAARMGVGLDQSTCTFHPTRDLSLIFKDLRLIHPMHRNESLSRSSRLWSNSPQRGRYRQKYEGCLIRGFRKRAH